MKKYRLFIILAIMAAMLLSLLTYYVFEKRMEKIDTSIIQPKA